MKTPWSRPVLTHIAYIIKNHHDGKPRDGHSGEETTRRYTEACKMRDEARADGADLKRYGL